MAWDPKNPEPAEFAAGLAGMVAHENRLLNDPTELLSAEGVAMDDLLIRKEPGLAAYDTSGIVTAPGFGGTLSAAVDIWAASILVFESTTTPSFVKSLTSGTANVVSPATSGTIVLTVPAGGVAAGDIVVVSVSLNEDDIANAMTVTDTGGNTYTAFGDVTPPTLLGVFYSKIVTPLAAGNSITISFSGLTTADQTVNVVAVADQFTGITSSSPTATNTVTSGTGTAVSIGVSTSVTLPAIAIVAVGNTGNGGSGATVTLAAGSGYVKHTEAGNAGAALNVDDRAVRNASGVFATAAKIITITDWYSDAITTPAGTVTTTAGSTTVTGSGTTFTNHAPGDRIVVNNETRIISSIASNTSLTTTTAWLSSNTGSAYSIRVGNRLVTATSGGNLFKEKPTTLTTGDIDAVTLRSGLSLSARPGRFVAGGKEAAALARKLFFLNGVDPIQVLEGDGTTATNIDLPADDWGSASNQGTQPINAVVHQNRLVAFGNLNDPHRAYFSDPDNHEDFTVANTETFDIRFRSDIGDRLYCGVSYQGILFFWKYPRGIFYLDDTSLTATEWLIRPKSESLGCAPSPYAALSIDDDVIFIDPNAHFHLLSAVDVLGGARASDIILRLGLSRWIRENVNLKRLDLTVSYWYPQKKLAVFYVPGTDANENTLALKFDFSGRERDLPVKFSFSRRDRVPAAAVRRASDGGPETPVIGEDAFVYLADQEARVKNGLGYTMDYRLPNLDCAHISDTLRTAKKLPEHLELIMEPVAAGTLTVDFYIDGTVAQTLVFDATKTRDKKKLNVGAGWTWSVRVRNAIANEEGKILSHIVYFKVGDQSYAYGERNVGLADA